MKASIFVVLQIKQMLLNYPSKMDQVSFSLGLLVRDRENDLLGVFNVQHSFTVISEYLLV